jgi:UPF0755 protein
MAQVSRGRLTVAVAVAVAVSALWSTMIAAAAGPGLRQFHVPFPEGFTRAQMIQRVAAVARIADGELTSGRVTLTAAGYAKASERAVVPCFGKGEQTNLEGFLFPSTYAFDRRTLGSNLVANQITAFCDQWSKLDLAYARSKKLTSYDVLVIASMVEEETSRPGERPKVAAVIYNRLRLAMPLGIDATLRYGLHIPATKSITHAELQSNNPYNTRKFTGLPPTSIGNPGFPSLKAAAHPSTLGYLYYARIPGSNQQQFFESYTAYKAFLAAHGYGPHP